MYGMKWSKVLAAAGIAVILGVFALQGCGSKESSSESSQETNAKKEDGVGENDGAKDLTEDMKEFTSKDGSVSIMLDKSWVSSDAGLDSWMMIGSPVTNDGLVLMQFLKDSSLFSITGIEDMKSSATSQEEASNVKDTDAPSIPGMRSLEAQTFTLTQNGQSAEVFAIYGETDYAYYSLMYTVEELDDDTMAFINASSATFKDIPVEVTDNSVVEVTDTVRWFNASCAILTALNGWDLSRFGGLPLNDTSAIVAQNTLSDSWGVTDKASADENLDWIITEGHRADFISSMKSIEESGMAGQSEDARTQFLMETFGLNEDEAKIYSDAYKFYETKGEKAIDGWDYCRALSLLGLYYVGGYYTDTEALDKSLEIAKIMQEKFESWDEVTDSYLAGYEFWAEVSSQERRQIYEELKAMEAGPYTVDFKMTLEKTW